MLCVMSNVCVAAARTRDAIGVLANYNQTYSLCTYEVHKYLVYCMYPIALPGSASQVEVLPVDGISRWQRPTWFRLRCAWVQEFPVSAPKYYYHERSGLKGVDAFFLRTCGGE